MEKKLESVYVETDAIFRVFTRTPKDPYTYVIDVRDRKEWKRGHVALSYCVRLTANGATLLDYSQNEYSVPWSPACYWGKPVLVYGPSGLNKKEHPVIKFIEAEGKASSLQVFRGGFEAIEKKLPYLVTASIRPNCAKAYPSEILPGLLYLGDFDHAVQADRLKEINVKNIVSIHNNPENLKPGPGVKHLKFTLADIDSENIAQFFEPTFEFIEAAAARKEATLVHCGAGVSRSACLVMSYLMRKSRMNADKCDAFVKERRSIVEVNDGFFRQLCQLEALVGIVDRSDPRDHHGGHGADFDDEEVGGAAAAAAAAVAFERPAVQVVAAGKSRWGAGAEDRGERLRDRSRRSRSRSRDRRDRRDRSYSRDRGRDRGHRRNSRSRSRSRDREYRRRDDRDSRRDRDRDGPRRSHSRSRDRDSGRGDRVAEEKHREQRAAPAAVAPPPATAAPPPPAPSAPAGAHPLSKAFYIEVSKDGVSVASVAVPCLQPGQRVVFGRQADCEVVMEHASISRQHAQLSMDLTGSLLVADLGSQHGTNVGGVWVKPRVAKPVGEGTVLRFGASTRQYVLRQVRPVGKQG